MDAMSEYMGNIAEDKIVESQCIMAVPARVIKVMTNNMCLVELIANGTRFVVPNWSGCDVQAGDEVRLFYTGSIVSERTAYVGAAAYMTNRLWSCVKGNYIVDDPTSQRKYRRIPTRNESAILISRYGFRSTHPQTVLVTFNGRVQANPELDFGVTSVEIYIDGNKYDFDYSISLQSLMSYCPIVSLPFQISLGDHVVEVKISGDGTYLSQVVSPGFYYDVCSYVTGQGLTEVEVNNG